jgi:hypothetical protein
MFLWFEMVFRQIFEEDLPLFLLFYLEKKKIHLIVNN